MGKLFNGWTMSAMGLFAVIGAVVKAVTYFPSVPQLENRVRPIEMRLVAVEDATKELSQDAKYQSILRQYEFLLKQNAKDPKDLDVKLQLETTKKIKAKMECDMWGEEFCKKPAPKK